jgi:hypothetical protein
MTEAPKPLSEILQSVDSEEGRRHLAEHLKGLPYLHFEQGEFVGLLVRIDADGKRTLGHFVNRQFQAIEKS